MTRFLGLLLLSLTLCYSLPSLADYEFITEAEVLVVDTATPPLEPQQWRQTFLPRAWSIDPEHPKDTRSAWYRIALPTDLQNRQWDQILMLRHILNVEIWLDDQSVAVAPYPILLRHDYSAIGIDQYYYRCAMRSPKLLRRASSTLGFLRNQPTE